MVTPTSVCKSLRPRVARPAVNVPSTGGGTVVWAFAFRQHSNTWGADYCNLCSRSVSVCLLRGFVVQTRLNGLRSCLGQRLLETQRAKDGVQISPTDSMQPSPNYLDYLCNMLRNVCLRFVCLVQLSLIEYYEVGKQIVGWMYAM